MHQEHFFFVKKTDVNNFLQTKIIYLLFLLLIEIKIYLVHLLKYSEIKFKTIKISNFPNSMFYTRAIITKPQIYGSIKTEKNLQNKLQYLPLGYCPWKAVDSIKDIGNGINSIIFQQA